MATKINDMDKQQIAICEEMFAKYPRPFKTNNVIGSASAMVSFYNALDNNSKRFYQYMNPERMISLLWQVIKLNNEKTETRQSAIKLLNKVIDSIVVN
jgi:hypothetical protein